MNDKPQMKISQLPTPQERANQFQTIAVIALKLMAVAGLLYCFLVSIGLMGSAFKGFGKDFAVKLIKSTDDPFVGLFIGVLATSLVQSSSTVTSVVVGIVGAGAVVDPSLVGNSIFIIMGANIGTTVTNTLVALGHVGRKDEFRRAIAAATVHDFFNLICVAVMFPLELATGYLRNTATFMADRFQDFGGVKFTSPVKTLTEPAVHLLHNVTHWLVRNDTATYIVMLVISMAILFFALYFIVKVMKSLIVERAEIILNNILRKSPLLGIFAGLIFTTIVQSSSITTSLLVPLVAAGILTVESVFPMTIGANVGTTTTAILASFATGNIAAITIAFAHLLFNLTGAICIYPIKHVRMVPISLAKAFGNLAANKKRYAFAYVLGVFFVIPGLLILITRLLK